MIIDSEGKIRTIESFNKIALLLEQIELHFHGGITNEDDMCGPETFRPLICQHQLRLNFEGWVVNSKKMEIVRLKLAYRRLPAGDHTGNVVIGKADRI